MLLLGVLMLIVFIGGVGVVAQRANRPVSRTGASTGGKAGSSGKNGTRASTGRKTAASGARSGGTRKPSWLLKAWNASGAPKTSETTLGGAGAVLTGKAAGAVSRGGWLTARKTGRAGRWFAGRTLIPFDRWIERKHAGLENAAELRDATPPPVFVHPKHADKPHEGEPVSANDMWNANLRAGAVPETWVNGKKATSGSASAPSTPLKVDAGGGNASVPPTLAPHLDYIAQFDPEDDAELLNMLAAEVHGAHAYAEAVSQMFDNCVTGKGLDPAAMQGVSDYADAHTENAANAARAHQQFVSVYDAIIEAANNGTVMPYNGRFFSGESAA